MSWVCDAVQALIVCGAAWWTGGALYRGLVDEYAEVAEYWFGRKAAGG